MNIITVLEQNVGKQVELRLIGNLTMDCLGTLSHDTLRHGFYTVDMGHDVVSRFNVGHVDDYHIRGGHLCLWVKA